MPWRGPEEPGEYPTLGYSVGEWIESHVVIPDGYRQGQPYRLTDEMWRFLLKFYRLYEHAEPYPAPDGLRYTGAQFRRSQKWGKDPLGAAIILAEALGPTRFDGWDARGEPVGKPYPSPLIACLGTSEDQPLALDTPVPTPTGWTTVGALRPGDQVFGTSGEPLDVIRETEVLLGEPCYRVTFSNGDAVTATASHSWTVEDGGHRGPRRRHVTLSTADLAKGCRTSRGLKRYRLPVVRWDLPDRHDLPVEPYLLGLWLGDGRTADALIAADWRHRDELSAIIEPLLRPNERVTWTEAHGNQASLRIRNHTRHAASGPSFRERLRAVGVLGDKHVPAAYLRAGTKQRLALLQGLMDSDGHIEPNGRATFTNVNRRLVDGVAELLTSLGYQWFLRFDSMLAWRLQFVPDSEPIARLSHKVARQRARTARSTSMWHYIVSVEPVPSVPTRCIGVNAADHLFLVGRRGVPTHNTDNTWRPLLSMIRLGPLADLPNMDAGQTRIDLPGGGRIEPVTTSAKARLGAQLTFVTITESHLFTLQGGFRRVAAAVKRNVAGMDGRWLELTNAWDPTEGSEAQVTAEAEDPRVLIDTVEPHRVDDLTDETAVYRELLRQYGDSARERGGWVNIKGRIMDEMASKRHLPADKRRFFLNEIVVGESVLVDPIRWDLFAREDQLQPGDEIALGFDGSKSSDSTALVAVRRSDNRMFCLRMWERPAAAVSWQVDRVDVDKTLTGVFGAYRVGYLYADPYRWQDYLDVWSARWPKQVVEFPTNVEIRMDKAIERFTTAFADGALTHAEHGRFTWHMKNAVIVKGSRRKIRPGEDELLPSHYLKLAKRGDGQLIDGAVAGVLALAALGQSIEDNMWETEPEVPFFAAWR